MENTYDDNAYLGEIRMFAGTYAPEGWFFCDGRSLNINEHQALYALIGDIYGSDATTFKLPDLRGRIPVHAGTGPGLTERTCGKSLGEEKVTLTESHLPTHSHTVRLAAGAANSAAPKDHCLAASSVNCNMYNESSAGSETYSLHSKSIGETGTRSAHENMMPSLCINFIIAWAGIYPDFGSGKQE